MKRGLLGSFTVCAAALALVACGGDDSGSDTTAAAATTAAATTAPATTAPATTTAATTAAPTTAATTAAPATTTTAAPTTTVAATTTEPAAPQLRILVTNDDGVASEGIDAVAQVLLAEGHDVTVVAPATQQSGQGGNETGGPLTGNATTTASGIPATGVEGFPADSVIWAIDQGGIDFVPDLVVSGANEGQNLGPVIDFSGTVGAARAAANRNIPAIAVSAGFGEPVDYEAATTALLAYLDEHIDAIAAHEAGTPVAEIVSINTPTCAAGTIRGTVEVPLGTQLYEFDYLAPVDCTSTLEGPADDVQAFFNGFVAVSPTPLQPAATG